MPHAPGYDYPYVFTPGGNLFSDAPQTYNEMLLQHPRYKVGWSIDLCSKYVKPAE